MKARAVAALAALVLPLGACGLPGVGAPGQAPAAGGVVTQEQSARILERVLKADTALRSGDSAAANAIMSTYAGEGTRAAKATALLISKGVMAKATSSPKNLTVLANSRGTGYPRYLVGASQEDGQALPMIYLLVATNAAVPYRYTLSAQALPGAQITAFPSAQEGSLVVTDGSDMPVKPLDLLQAYSKGLSVPSPQAPYEPDVFSEQVRVHAADMRASVAPIADFAQTNQVLPDPIVALRQSDGGTLVFGAIERTSNYAIKDGSSMLPNALFSAFVPGQTALVQQARTTTVQFLVFSVPKQGKARLVAATEMMVSATGY